MSGTVATGASATITGNVLVINNINTGQMACNELRISGVRVDGRGLPSGSSVTVTFSGGGGNTIVSGQTLATVVSAFSEAKTVTLADPVSFVATGGSALNSFTITEGYPNAWTSPNQDSAGEGDNGLELDFWIENLPDGATLDFWAGPATAISGTLVADDGDLAGPVTLCSTGCAVTNTASITGDGTDTAFTLQFNPAGTGGQDPTPATVRRLCSGSGWTRAIPITSQFRCPARTSASR